MSQIEQIFDTNKGRLTNFPFKINRLFQFL